MEVFLVLASATQLDYEWPWPVFCSVCGMVHITDALLLIGENSPE